MKSSLSILACLFIVGCTSSDSSLRESYNKMQTEYDSATQSLSECNSRLNRLQSDWDSLHETVAQPKEEEQPKEETVELYTTDTPVKARCQTAEVKECGVNLSDCLDGAEFYCLHNVVLKKTTETVSH